MLPTRIILDSDELVTVHLRDVQSARTVRSEAILDVNNAGRWIRGIELLGGVGFNLETAVKPFNPRRPLSGESGGVTYDEEANAVFIYFSMKSPLTHVPETALGYSHSITPNAELAFDSQGGLVWLRFSPRDANKSTADFVLLIDAPVQCFSEESQGAIKISQTDPLPTRASLRTLRLRTAGGVESF